MASACPFRESSARWRSSAAGSGLRSALVTLLAADLDLPAVDPNDPELSGDVFVTTMTALAEQTWLTRTPLGYLTLDRAAGEFFLRNRAATFPGQKIAELFGIDSGPLREEIDRNILHIDGDDHRRLRNLLNPFFTQRAADRWRPTMRRWLEQIWSQLDGATTCEFVDQVAKLYPSLTIATVMGAAPEDASQLHHWSAWIQRQ